MSGYHSKCALQSKWQGSEEGFTNSIMFTCWNILDFYSIIWWGFPTTFPREYKRKIVSLWRWTLLALQAGTEELGDHTHPFRIFKRGSSCIIFRISSQLLWFNRGSNKSPGSPMCAGALYDQNQEQNDEWPSFNINLYQNPWTHRTSSSISNPFSWTFGTTNA